MEKIVGDRDLRVYQMAFQASMDLLPLVHALPPAEKWRLRDQIRRGRRSVCSAIAEARRNRRYPAAFAAKRNEAETESAELQVHLQFAAADGYLSDEVAAAGRRTPPVPQSPNPPIPK